MNENTDWSTLPVHDEKIDGERREDGLAVVMIPIVVNKRIMLMIEMIICL